jgi:putative ABC transport system permease protein
MAILSLALRSLWNRRYTVLLTVVSIALSVTLLLGVERLRTETRESFANTISGTDLIVGARSGPVQLLLYSVFRIGNATNNISWQSYQEIAALPEVKWAVPLSLGDSHRGFRVLGTTTDYFEHYRYGRAQPLSLAHGEPFSDLYDAVLGAAVAEALGYTLGQAIVIAHGAGEVSFAQHDDKPFRVVGILERTGTPVDRTVHVSLEGIEAIHLGWMMGAPMPGLEVSAEQARSLNLTPKTITAFLLGLEARAHTFRVQRAVNQYRAEPLLAVLPGVALGELWSLVGIAENALLVVSGFVVVVGLFGLMTALLTSLGERRREMAVLRSVGARPAHVFGLIMGEAGALALLGVLLGLATLYFLMLLAGPLVDARFGIHLGLGWPSAYELGLLAAVLFGSILIGAIPAYRAYRYSLADGLTVRL